MSPIKSNARETDKHRTLKDRSFIVDERKILIITLLTSNRTCVVIFLRAEDNENQFWDGQRVLRDYRIQDIVKLEF